MSIFKFFSSARRSMYEYQSSLTLLYYRVLFPRAVFGRGCRMYGIPHFYLHREGSLELGTGCKLVSTTAYNPIGAFPPCAITVQRNASLRIGDGCGFSGVSIYCAESISIGNEVLCGAGVCIWDTDFHPADVLHRPDSKISAAVRPVVLEDNVFIGARSIILKGTRIGQNSVIGAGSVVSGKQIAPNEIWAGNPARFIRKITPFREAEAEVTSEPLQSMTC